MTEPVGFIVLDRDGAVRGSSSRPAPTLQKGVEFAERLARVDDYAPYTIHPVMPAVATYPKQPEVRWGVVDKNGLVVRQLSGKYPLTESDAKDAAYEMNSNLLLPAAPYHAVKLTIEEA